MRNGGFSTGFGAKKGGPPAAGRTARVFARGALVRAARGVLFGEGMHAILFGLKRTYWGSIARSRRPLHEHQPHLTAARFDMMHAIQQQGPKQSVLQSELRRVLGVCRPVVTRMLQSLMQLGWVVRTRSDVDRRTYAVRLTEAGAKVIEWAYYRFVTSVRAKRWVNQALIGMEKWPDLALAFTATAALDEQLTCMRAVWNAGGTLYYPWHPDD